MRRSFPAVFVALAALLCGILVWLFLPLPASVALLDEGGPIELATLGVYGLALLALGLHREVATDKWSWAALLVVITAFAAREMDQHLAWTDYSVLKLSFYLHPVPLHQKITAAAFVGAFAIALVYLAVRHARAMLAGLRRGDPLAVTVAVFLAMLVLSKVLDRSVSLLVRDLGVPVPLSARVLVQAIEEMFELALPVLVLVECLRERRIWARGRSQGLGIAERGAMSKSERQDRRGG